MTKFVKSVLSFLFVLFLIFGYYTFINQDIEIKTVFSENISYDNDFYNYILDFKDTLNSKNFNNKFSILEKDKYQIKKLYVSVNEMWNEQIKEQLKEYNFDNINNFILNYKKTLQKHNMLDEIPNIDIYGIKINKVLIYTSKENIETITNKYNIKYEKK